MNAGSSTFDLRQAGTLLRGESEQIARWTDACEVKQICSCVATIFAGAGLFGAALGEWRSPLQALYGGVKFPLVILLTTAGTALLNGMLAPVLGLNAKFRQSLLGILFSYTIAAMILGAFSPIVLFVVFNLPSITNSASARVGHSCVLLAEVSLIAFAGVLANVRLRQLLDRLGGSALVSNRVIFSWLAANLFFGAQISWLLRPFVGSPGLPVAFLRPDAFHGNFYETVFRAIKNIL